MKPILEHLPPNGNESFFVKAFDLPYFGTPWHYHPEFELVMVVEGEGKKIIGNAVSDFKAGDITLLGSGLPHIYRNSSNYYEPTSHLRAKSIVVHFLEKSIGRDFLSLPQCRILNSLFKRAEQGIDLYSSTKLSIRRKMFNLLNCEGFSRLLLLLDILHEIAESTEVSLNSDRGIIGHNLLDTERLSKIFNYVLINFSQRVTLDEVASLVHMTSTSFCRFFRDRTKRNFIDYLIEIRLHHAAHILLSSSAGVTAVCYSSGFNNLSNFNRHFRKKYKVSPKEYRKLGQQ